MRAHRLRFLNSKAFALKAQLIELKPKLQEEYSINQLGIFGCYVRGEQTDEKTTFALIRALEVIGEATGNAQ